MVGQWSPPRLRRKAARLPVAEAELKTCGAFAKDNRLRDMEMGKPL